MMASLTVNNTGIEMIYTGKHYAGIQHTTVQASIYKQSKQKFKLNMDKPVRTGTI